MRERDRRQEIWSMAWYVCQSVHLCLFSSLSLSLPHSLCILICLSFHLAPLFTFQSITIFVSLSVWVTLAPPHSFSSPPAPFRVAQHFLDLEQTSNLELIRYHKTVPREAWSPQELKLTTKGQMRVAVNDENSWGRLKPLQATQPRASYKPIWTSDSLPVKWVML